MKLEYYQGRKILLKISNFLQFQAYNQSSSQNYHNLGFFVKIRVFKAIFYAQSSY